MTIELYNQLKKYDNLFYTATQRNYVMFGSIEVKKELSKVYTQLFGKKSNMLSGCGTCALTEMKEIANQYYQFEQSLQLQVQEIVEETVEKLEEETVQPKTTTKIKRTRKK